MSENAAEEQWECYHCMPIGKDGHGGRIGLRACVERGQTGKVTGDREREQARGQRQVEHRLTPGWRALSVGSPATVRGDPGRGSFPHPSSREHRDACGQDRVPHDLHAVGGSDPAPAGPRRDDPLTVGEPPVAMACRRRPSPPTAPGGEASCQPEAADAPWPRRDHRWPPPERAPRSVIPAEVGVAPAGVFCHQPSAHRLGRNRVVRDGRSRMAAPIALLCRRDLLPEAIAYPRTTRPGARPSDGHCRRHPPPWAPATENKHYPLDDGMPTPFVCVSTRRPRFHPMQKTRRAVLPLPITLLLRGLRCGFPLPFSVPLGCVVCLYTLSARLCPFLPVRWRSGSDSERISRPLKPSACQTECRVLFHLLTCSTSGWCRRR